MIEAKKTTPADILAMQGHELAPLKVQWDHFDHDNAVTAWDGDKMLCIGGINSYWTGVGEGWVVLHENAVHAKMPTYRAIKEVLEKLMQAHDYHRVQAVLRVNWDRAIKMAEKLGFEREGLMRKYCENGDDAYLYAMVKE